MRSSNAGHCLCSGIASDYQAQRTAATLLDGDSFSQWGVRTLSASTAAYNPMSYHNGSVWPHDNAIIAAGLARYENKAGSLKILQGLFNASLFVDLHRLPELFCGFSTRAGEEPTLYPVACAPQSWASASVFWLLQSCLGLEVDGVHHQIIFTRPALPGYLTELSITDLSVNDASADLLYRHGEDVVVTVLRRTGEVKIIVIK